MQSMYYFAAPPIQSLPLTYGLLPVNGTKIRMLVASC